MQNGTLTTDAADGVLANDTDPGGLALTVEADAPPGHGELTLYFDGSFKYQPDAGYTGTDSFVYEATNGQHSSMATVTITVTPVNNTAAAVDDAYATFVDTTLAIPAPGLLGQRHRRRRLPLATST